MPAERYRIADVEWFDSGDGQQSVHSHNSGRAVPITATQAAILAGRRQSLPLEEHALHWARQTESAPLRQLAKHMPGFIRRRVENAAAAMTPSAASIQEARDQLHKLAEAGILVSDASFVAFITANSHASPGAKISRVGLPTRNRPEALRRGIASYCENGRTFGRSFEFVIVDDSREPAAEEQTRAVLRELHAEYGFVMRFAGLAEREAFAVRLAQRSGVDLDLARFAVLGDAAFPLTTGSVRNCVLLDAANEPILMGDDDGVCRVSPWCEEERGLAFSSKSDPTEFLFFADRDKTLAAANFKDIDLLAAHESLLGRTISDKLRERSDLPELSGLSPTTEERMRREGGRVLATMAGVIGDSGIGSSAYLDIDLSSARRLSISEAFYRTAVSSRQVIRATPQETIGDSPFCMSGNLAVDTRELPPLFTPVLRNSDGVFGRLLRECHRGAYSGAIPYAVMHDPLEQRSYSFDAWRSDAARVRYADALLLLFGGLTLESNSRGESCSYQQVARYITERSATPADLHAELHSLALRRAEARSNRPEESLPSDLPAFYRQLHVDNDRILRQHAAEASYVIPRDIREVSNSDDDAIARCHALTVRLARLYDAWPSLWQAAGELAKDGVRLTQPV